VAREVEFGEFFASQYPQLCRLGYWLTGDWGQAEDLAQEALVRAYWCWPLVRRLDRPDQYTRKVLVNRYRSLLRRALVEARHAGRVQRRSTPSRPTTTARWCCGRRCGGCRSGSGRCWCCATSRTCPRPRWPACSACRWAR
jgi:DNA-directed RNA polymerase specialized sigma24 family protein